MTGKDLYKTIKFEATVDLSKTTKSHARVNLSKIINFETTVHLLFPKYGRNWRQHCRHFANTRLHVCQVVRCPQYRKSITSTFTCVLRYNEAHFPRIVYLQIRQLVAHFPRAG